VILDLEDKGAEADQFGKGMDGRAILDGLEQSLAQLPGDHDFLWGW